MGLITNERLGLANPAPEQEVIAPGELDKPVMKPGKVKKLKKKAKKAAKAGLAAPPGVSFGV